MIMRMTVILVILILKDLGSPRHPGKGIKIVEMRGGGGQRLSIHHQMSNRLNFAAELRHPRNFVILGQGERFAAQSHEAFDIKLVAGIPTAARRSSGTPAVAKTTMSPRCGLRKL